MMRTCVICGAVFETKSPRARICGYKCRLALERERRRERRGTIEEIQCAECGNWFTPNKFTAKYCGQECLCAAGKPNGKLTRTTVYLICIWHKEGDSVRDIARDIGRDERVIARALHLARLTGAYGKAWSRMWGERREAAP